MNTKTFDYLPEASAIISESNEAQTLFENEDVQTKNVIKGKPDYVPWGSDDNLPDMVQNYIGKNEVLSANIQFNVAVVYGQGIKVYEKAEDGLKDVESPEVLEFLSDNNINRYWLEQVTDMCTFYNPFPEIILNKKGDKIIVINHKEAIFSRWATMNKKGRIEYHYYSAQFSEGKADKTNTTPTPALSARNPLFDLKSRMESHSKDRRFIIPIYFPTPGKKYYQRPHWWSIFESGWYDFDCLIPTYKKALLTNQMSIKYHIELSDQYFPMIFKQEGITDKKKQDERRKKEYEDFKNFLSGAANTGKSFFSVVRQTADGKELPMVKITVLDQKKVDGQYVEDSEEASTRLSYAMGVHPSIIGSTPGKNKNSLSGTDKRELFTIKQALIKPYRDLLLEPLRVIAKYNKWENIIFTVPDIELTTLDKGTDSKTVNKEV